MKSTLTSLVVGFLMAASASATTENFSPAELAALPALRNVFVSESDVPANADVESTRFVNFTYESCGKRFFETKTSNIENVVFVRVQMLLTPDCAGPTITREYRLSIGHGGASSEFPVIVLNPVHTVFNKIEERPRMCTQIAGQVYNAREGKCISFTNGCQLSELQAIGYTTHIPEGVCGK